MTSLFDNLDVDGLPEVLTPSRRLTNRRNAERLDLGLPTCPFCAEINFPGVARCGNCCAPLYARLGRGSDQRDPREASTSGYAGLTQPRPTQLCPTCLVECDDLTCPICGGLLRKAA